MGTVLSPEALTKLSEAVGLDFRCYHLVVLQIKMFKANNFFSELIFLNLDNRSNPSREGKSLERMEICPDPQQPFYHQLVLICPASKDLPCKPQANA